MRRAFWLACLWLAASSSLSAQEPKLRSTLKCNTAEVESSRILNPDGKTMASTGQDRTIRLWNAATGKNVATLKLDEADNVEHSCVAFCPDGKTLALGSSEGIVKLWDVASGKNTGSLDGYDPGAMLSIVFSPDGKTLAAASDDVKVRLWDVANRRTLSPLSILAGSFPWRLARTAKNWPRGTGATASSNFGTWPRARTPQLSRMNLRSGPWHLAQTARLWLREFMTGK